MKFFLVPLAVAAVVVASPAHAELSLLNATCPGNIEVHVDQGGPVYINGKEAKLKRVNDNYYEASNAATGVTVSISKNPDGSSDVSYTGKNRANGICQVASNAVAEPKPAHQPKPASRETHPAAEKACLAAVAKKTNVAATGLQVIEAMGAESGILVKVRVPDADAPWDCMTDKNGKPWSVNYSGSEGAL